MITIKKRISLRSRGDAIMSGVNGALSEIQAIFNKIGTTRYVVSDPESDYLRLDVSAEKLYLHTIEGKKYEISMTEVA